MNDLGDLVRAIAGCQRGRDCQAAALEIEQHFAPGLGVLPVCGHSEPSFGMSENRQLADVVACTATPGSRSPDTVVPLALAIHNQCITVRYGRDRIAKVVVGKGD